jgi:protein-tyrosine-phosphatase
MGFRILFVCVGNICRSPMAEGIARAICGDGIEAESAGIAAVAGNPPSQEAVGVMRAVYGTDISGHRARGLDRVRMADFNCVIALDRIVIDRIRALGIVPEKKLAGWDIGDPIGLGPRAYEEAARKIDSCLRVFAAERGFKCTRKAAS